MLARIPSRLARALFALQLLLALAAPRVDAQSSLHFYEIGVDAGEGAGVDVSLYNAATGERYWGPYTVSNTNAGGSDLGFDTHGPLGGPVTSTTSNGVTTVIVPAVGFFLVEFSGGDLLAPISYAWTEQTAPFATGSFYKPVVVQGSPDTYFTLVNGHMSVVSNDGAGTTTPIDQILGERGWTLPYDRATVCAAVTCISGGIYGPGPTQFISAGVSSTTVSGHPTWRKLVPTFEFKGAVVPVASWPNLTWNEPGLTLKFASGGLFVSEVLDVSGALLTAVNPSAGWGGVQFLAGSGGAWTNGTVIERVAGEDPGNQTVAGLAAVTVTDASPTFTDVTVQLPVTGTILSGLSVTRVSGTATVVATRTQIVNMTGRGIAVNGAARLDLRRGEVSGSTGAGLTTSGGATTDAYLYPYTNGTNSQGPSITGNTGGGVAAAGGSEVRFGTDNASAPGYGLATVAQNPGRGLSTTGGSLIDAGSGTASAGKYQRNRIYANQTSNATTGNALASGTSSRVYARCDWWSTEPHPFRTGQASGGLVDVSFYLTSDPYSTSSPSCVAAPVIDPGRPGTSNVRVAGLGRGTAEAEGSGLDRLAE
ncbi:MAG TPA: hypothetical protein VF576_03585, partial [Rubricoccaceae bacterium]